MRNYEIMFIIRPTLGEDEVKKVVNNFKKVITDNGSKVTDVKEMGQRELAYEIRKFNTGYYYLFVVEANADAEQEFSRVARINESLLRHLIVKVDEKEEV